MLRRALALLLVLPLGASACAGDDGGTDTGAGTTASTPATSTTSAADDSTSAAATEASTGAAEPMVTVSGDAFFFGAQGGRIQGGTVTILELPDEITYTDADGHFSFELPAQAEATFVFDKTGFPRTYTKTFTLPAEGEMLERVTFQVPNDGMFDLLAAIVMIEPDPAACQIASTVTRVGKSVYDEGAHGEDGATVTIEPPLPAEHGPIYFNADVIPDLALTETSVDGGILYTNVPPGTYHITAHKAGVEFIAVDVVCDPDVLVNPSPPFGLQAL